MYNSHLNPRLHAATADERCEPIVPVEVREEHGQSSRPVPVLRHTGTHSLLRPSRERNRSEQPRGTRPQGVMWSLPVFSPLEDNENEEDEGPNWSELIFAAGYDSRSLRNPGNKIKAPTGYLRERRNAVVPEESTSAPAFSLLNTLSRGNTSWRDNIEAWRNAVDVSPDAKPFQPRLCIHLKNPREAAYYRREREQRAAAGRIPLLSYTSFTQQISEILEEQKDPDPYQPRLGMALDPEAQISDNYRLLRERDEASCPSPQGRVLAVRASSNSRAVEDLPVQLEPLLKHTVSEPQVETSEALRRPRLAISLSGKVPEIGHYSRERERKKAQRAETGPVPVVSYNSFTRTISEYVEQAEKAREQTETGLTNLFPSFALTSDDEYSSDDNEYLRGSERTVPTPADHQQPQGGPRTWKETCAAAKVPHLAPLETLHQGSWNPKYKKTKPREKAVQRSSPGKSVAKATVYVPDPPPRSSSLGKTKLPQHVQPKAARVFDCRARRSYRAGPADDVSQAYRPALGSSNTGLSVSRFTSNLNKPSPPEPGDFVFGSLSEFPFPRVSQIRDEAGNERSNAISPPQEARNRANRNSALSQFAVPQSVRPTAAQRILETNSPASPSRNADRSDAGKSDTAGNKSPVTDNEQGKLDNGEEPRCDNCEHLGRDEHDVWCEVAHSRTLR